MGGGQALKQVAVITDSIACLTREHARQYDIGVVPINILFEGKVYRDWVDITPTEAYQLFLKNPDAFASSAPSPAEFLNAYSEASKRASEILCVTVSSQLSATYSSALMAKEYATREIPGVTIELIDSWTATASEGFIALEAARAAAGKTLTEVTRVANAVKDKVKVYVLLDTFQHVYRSGRVPKIAAQAGSLFNIRPMFNVSGKVHFCGIVRSRERGIQQMLQKITDDVGTSPVHMAVLHAYAPEEAEKLRERVAREFHCVELWTGEFSPVMGYACGTGTLALAYFC